MEREFKFIQNSFFISDLLRPENNLANTDLSFACQKMFNPMGIPFSCKLRSKSAPDLFKNTKPVYSYSPVNKPETHHALKLVPSRFPRGIAIFIVCWPGSIALMGTKTGLVAVPGHHPERL